VGWGALADAAGGRRLLARHAVVLLVVTGVECHRRGRPDGERALVWHWWRAGTEHSGSNPGAWRQESLDRSASQGLRRYRLPIVALLESHVCISRRYPPARQPTRMRCSRRLDRSPWRCRCRPLSRTRSQAQPDGGGSPTDRRGPAHGRQSNRREKRLDWGRRSRRTVPGWQVAPWGTAGRVAAWTATDPLVGSFTAQAPSRCPTCRNDGVWTYDARPFR